MKELPQHKYNPSNPKEEHKQDDNECATCTWESVYLAAAGAVSTFLISVALMWNSTFHTM